MLTDRSADLYRELRRKPSLSESDRVDITRIDEVGDEATFSKVRTRFGRMRRRPFDGGAAGSPSDPSEESTSTSVNVEGGDPGMPDSGTAGGSGDFTFPEGFPIDASRHEAASSTERSVHSSSLVTGSTLGPGKPGGTGCSAHPGASTGA